MTANGPVFTCFAGSLLILMAQRFQYKIGVKVLTPNTAGEGCEQGSYQAVIRRVVEGQGGAGLQIVQLHKVPHILQHIHALGVGAIQPESASPAKPPLIIPSFLS